MQTSEPRSRAAKTSSGQNVGRIAYVARVDEVLLDIALTEARPYIFTLALTGIRLTC